MASEIPEFGDESVIPSFHACFIVLKIDCFCIQHKGSVINTILEGITITILQPNLTQIVRHIQNGTLDFILIKPVNSQFFLSLRYVCSYSIVSFIILSSLLLKLVYDYHGFISFVNLLFFSFSFILGILIFYCFEFIISCLVFWYRNFSVGGWLASEMTKYSRRPDSIYKGKFRRIVFTVFPMAMITSVPARILIFGPEVYLILSQILVTIVFLMITNLIWNRGLKLYESASS